MHRLPLILTAVLVCAGVASAQETVLPNPCAGLKIDSVRIQGCENTWCQSEHKRKKLQSLMELGTGIRWSAIQSNRALARLRETGFFQDVQTQCTPIRDGAAVIVVVQVTVNRRIRRLRIQGNQALYESDVSKQLILRPGTVYNPKTPEAQAIEQQQISQFQDLYQKEGFDEAKIRLEAKLIGHDGVDIVLHISEGRKAKITGIDVDMPPIKQHTAAALRPFGPSIRCVSISKRRVRLASKLEAGNVLTRRLQRRREQRVRDFLRARGRVRPEVNITHDRDTGRALIKVSAPDCYALRFFKRDDALPDERGYTRIRTDAILEHLPFRQSGRYDLDEAVASRSALEQWYQQQGYLFADVRMDYRTVSNDKQSGGGLVGVISYYTTLNYVTEIRNVTFRGNKHINNASIRAAMGTKTYDFFETGGYLLIEQMLSDLRAIKRLYHDKGYIGMRYRKALGANQQRPTIRRTKGMAGQDEVYDFTFKDLHFRLRKHPLESVIYVSIDIHEGKRINVGQRVLVGGLTNDNAHLQTTLTLQPESAFSPKTVVTDRNKIRRFYQEKGFHDVEVDVQCTDHRTQKKVASCTWDTVGFQAAQIFFTVKPGAQYRVGDRFVQGAFRTNPDLILEHLPKPGEPLNRFQIANAERKLRKLGVFSSIQIKPIGLDSPNTNNERIPLVAVVEERRAQFLDISAGFETLTTREDTDEGVPPEASSILSASIGVMDTAVWGQSKPAPISVPDLLMTVEIAYRNRNFLGRAQELIVPLKYGFSTGVVSLLGDKGNADGLSALHRYAKLSPTLYEPRLGGTELALQVTPFVRYDRASKTIDEFETGIETTLRRTFLDIASAHMTITGSAIQSGDFPNQKKEPMEPKVDLDFGLSLDFLDNPLNPTRGTMFSTGFSYINKREDGVFKNFLKWEGAIKAVANVRKALVVALYFRYADSYVIDGSDLPDVERYRLGGIQGMRGFLDDAIKPVDKNGDATAFFGGNVLLNGSIELRFPILRRLGFWGVGFFDWGALARHRSELKSQSVRTSVGLGLRYLIGGQVPLRIDYGVNIDRRCLVERTEDGCPAEQLEPAGVAQFALMYPF